MNIHQLIETHLILASDEGADIIVTLADEDGDMVAYTGRAGDYTETERYDLGDIDALDDMIAAAHNMLDDLINLDDDASIIEGEAIETREDDDNE